MAAETELPRCGGRWNPRHETLHPWERPGARPARKLPNCRVVLPPP